jgi:hypothetical protein
VLCVRGEEEMIKAEGITCPACGFYCLGKGGHGCIDKPALCECPSTDTEKRIGALKTALRKCRKVMTDRENEVGNRYGRAKSDIESIERDASNI